MTSASLRKAVPVRELSAPIAVSRDPVVDLLRLERSCALRALNGMAHFAFSFGIKLSIGTPVYVLIATASFREGVACPYLILEIMERSHFTSLASAASFIFSLSMYLASLFMSPIVNVMNVNVKHNVNDNAWSLKFSREKM